MGITDGILSVFENLENAASELDALLSQIARAINSFDLMFKIAIAALIASTLMLFISMITLAVIRQYLQIIREEIIKLHNVIINK